MTSPTLLAAFLALFQTAHCRKFTLDTAQLLTVHSTPCRHDTLVLNSAAGAFSDVVPVLIGPAALDQYAIVLPENGSFYLAEGAALAPGEASECAPAATVVSRSIDQPDCRFSSFHDPKTWRITPSDSADLPPLLHAEMVPTEYDQVELSSDRCTRLEIERPVRVGKLVLDGKEMSEKALYGMVWSVEGQLTFRPGAQIARKVPVDGCDFMWPSVPEHVIGIAPSRGLLPGNLGASDAICSHVACADDDDLLCADAITPADLNGAHCCPLCGVLLGAAVSSTGDDNPVDIAAWRKHIGDLVNVLNAEHGAKLTFGVYRASEHELQYSIVVGDTESGFDRALLVKMADSIRRNFMPRNVHYTYTLAKISAEKPLPATYPLLSAVLGACAMATLALCLAWRRGSGAAGGACGFYDIAVGWKGSRRNLLRRMRYGGESHSESMQLQETGADAQADAASRHSSPAAERVQRVEAKRDVVQFHNPVFGDTDSMAGVEE